MQASGEPHQPGSARDAKILFVTPRKLGGSLIALIVPANLARAGFKVTVRGDCAHDLAKWLPEIQTDPASLRWVPPSFVLSRGGMPTTRGVLDGVRSRSCRRRYLFEGCLGSGHTLSAYGKSGIVLSPF